MNELTDRQHLENIIALDARGGYVSEMTERLHRYLCLTGLISDDGLYSYITVSELNKIIPNKL